VTCHGSNGVGGEGGANGAEISGTGNGRSGGGVGNGKVAERQQRKVRSSRWNRSWGRRQDGWEVGRLKLVDGWSQLGVVSGLVDDVTSGGCLVLEDLLRLPTEWFEDRDGLPALTGQQVWGVGTVEHVVARVVDASAEVDGEGTFGNVVGVQVLLGSERRSLHL
jgi:hypothetical protein